MCVSKPDPIARRFEYATNIKNEISSQFVVRFVVCHTEMRERVHENVS